MKIMLGLFFAFCLALISVFFSFRLVLYVPIYASVEGSTFRTTAFVKVQGEAYGKKIDEYSGRYENVINFYSGVLEKIHAGNDVKGFFVNGTSDEVANFISVEQFGKGKIASEKLLSAIEYGGKTYLFTQRELIGYDIKPLMVRTIIDEGRGEYKVFPGNQLGVIPRALLEIGFRARENQAPIEFLGFFDALAINLGCFFSCQTYQESGYSIVVTGKKLSVNDSIVDLIEQGDKKLGVVINESYFSKTSVDTLKKWVEGGELGLDEISVSSLYGSGLKFSKIVPLSDECQIYVFSKKEGSMNVFVCNDLISNVFYSAENNEIFKGI
ncbi:hypothetical protein [Pelagibaculum spongiae]|uniref:Uncharacterized protein n=1 Tax=Pelagibaculum spongiae TaxID=2080658 RepID=A0A2V1GZX0_9GAMM|nr:hypothetical protein [Pelagibaculum spongiae]PVZ71753.1 hypothetical protein DC094_01625 [Pelagibaculum spongiae]